MRRPAEPVSNRTGTDGPPPTRMCTIARIAPVASVATATGTATAPGPGEVVVVAAFMSMSWVMPAEPAQAVAPMATVPRSTATRPAVNGCLLIVDLLLSQGGVAHASWVFVAYGAGGAKPGRASGSSHSGPRGGGGAKS